MLIYTYTCIRTSVSLETLFIGFQNVYFVQRKNPINLFQDGVVLYNPSIAIGNIIKCQRSAIR